MQRCHAVLGLLVAVTSLGACASTEEPGAVRAAQAFVSLAHSAPRKACALLAPRAAEQLAEDGNGECADGLTDADPPRATTVVSVSVAASSAQVVLPGQTVFLARFDSGWRVTAAGCVKVSSDDAVPYHCAVEGD